MMARIFTRATHLSTLANAALTCSSALGAGTVWADLCACPRRAAHFHRTAALATLSSRTWTTPPTVREAWCDNPHTHTHNKSPTPTPLHSRRRQLQRQHMQLRVPDHQRRHLLWRLTDRRVLLVRLPRLQGRALCRCRCTHCCRTWRRPRRARARLLRN